MQTIASGYWTAKSIKIVSTTNTVSSSFIGTTFRFFFYEIRWQFFAAQYPTAIVCSHVFCFFHKHIYSLHLFCAFFIRFSCVYVLSVRITWSTSSTMSTALHHELTILSASISKKVSSKLLIKSITVRTRKRELHTHDTPNKVRVDNVCMWYVSFSLFNFQKRMAIKLECFGLTFCCWHIETNGATKSE